MLYTNIQFSTSPELFRKSYNFRMFHYELKNKTSILKKHNLKMKFHEEVFPELETELKNNRFFKLREIKTQKELQETAELYNYKQLLLFVQAILIEFEKEIQHYEIKNYDTKLSDEVKSFRENEIVNLLHENIKKEYFISQMVKYHYNKLGYIKHELPNFLFQNYQFIFKEVITSLMYYIEINHKK